MPILPPIFYSVVIIITSFVAAFILSLRIRKNHILNTRFFFWHYMVGFVLLGLAHLPILLINLRIEISYNILFFLYIFSFFTIFIAHQLFLRGTNSLFIKDRIFTTIFPIVVFPPFAALTLFLLFISQIGPILIYTVLMWGFLIPINLYLTFIFLYFFIKGAPFYPVKRQFYALFLTLGWLVALITYIILWVRSAAYSPEFWALEVASSKEWLLIRTVAYFLIFVGTMFFSDRYYKTPKSIEKI